MLSINTIECESIQQHPFDQLKFIHSFDEWIKAWDIIVASQIGNDFNSGFEKIMNELESGIAKNLQFYHAPERSMPLPMLISQSIDSFHQNGDIVCTVIPQDAFKRVEDNGKTLYNCTWKNCERKFTRRSANCRAHWLRHKNKSPFVCLTCSLGFKRGVDLNRHRLIYHQPVNRF
jgi:hypothetical protein